METPLIRPANIADAAAIAAIMRNGMSPMVQRITILGSPLLHAYVEAHIGRSTGDPFAVAEVDGLVVGMATWRRMQGTLMLNHLYVSEQCRGQSIGTALLIDGLQRCASAEVQTVAVDVFAESIRPREWYAALGMQPQFRRIWLETTLPAPRSMSEGKCTVEWLDQADVNHAQQGFSQFKLITFTAEYMIGRLAEEVFRAFGFGILSDRPALEGLGTLDARRTLVCIGAQEDLPAEAQRNAQTVTESERLSVPLATLKAALKCG